MRKVTVLTLLVASVFVGAVPVLVAQPPASVARTGQVECYDTAGAQIACGGTGQDGDLQMGIAWPSPRFSANGDGTVIDNLTGLIWLQLLNCVAGVDWEQALVIANSLESGLCGLSDGSSVGDWRVPNIRELCSLQHFGTSYPSIDPDHPFFGIQPEDYWSSTSFIYIPENAWRCSFGYAEGPRGEGKSQSNYVFPVRGQSGPSAPAPVKQTGQTSCWDEVGDFVDCAGTGQDGEFEYGVEWPSPRFSDNGDGTATDELTGLVWLQDASCFGTQNTWQEGLGFANTLADGSCGLSDASQAGDWRLPNVKELESLTNYNVHSPALPFPNPFLGVETAYWTSTSRDDARYHAYVLSIGGGDTYTDDKRSSYSIWPVRGGISVNTVYSDGFESGDTSAWSSTVE